MGVSMMYGILQIISFNIPCGVLESIVAILRNMWFTHGSERIKFFLTVQHHLVSAKNNAGAGCMVHLTSLKCSALSLE